MNKREDVKLSERLGVLNAEQFFADAEIQNVSELPSLLREDPCGA